MAFRMLWFAVLVALAATSGSVMAQDEPAAPLAAGQILARAASEMVEGALTGRLDMLTVWMAPDFDYVQTSGEHMSRADAVAMTWQNHFGNRLDEVAEPEVRCFGDVAFVTVDMPPVLGMEAPPATLQCWNWQKLALCFARTAHGWKASRAVLMGGPDTLEGLEPTIVDSIVSLREYRRWNIERGFDIIAAGAGTLDRMSPFPQFQHAIGSMPVAMGEEVDGGVIIDGQLMAVTDPMRPGLSPRVVVRDPANEDSLDSVDWSILSCDVDVYFLGAVAPTPMRLVLLADNMGAVYYVYGRLAGEAPETREGAM